MEIFLGAFTSEWESRKAAFLLERAKLTKGGRGFEDDIEEVFTKYKVIAGSTKAGGLGGGSQKQRPRGRIVERQSAPRTMAARFAGLASGSQPAVVKMASYGGGARIGAMVEYVSREGAIAVETEKGELIEGRGELARIRGDWDHLVSNRAESRDIGGFTVAVGTNLDGLEGEARHERVRDILSSALGDRSYAYGIEQDARGRLSVSGIVVLRSGQGERLTADQKATDIVQERLQQAQNGSFAGANFAFQGHGNGVEYGTAKLRALVEHHRGDVRSDTGAPISDPEQAGHLVQKEWRRELHSRKSREVMHLIVSAKAGTDAAAFQAATREFLAEQFASAGHRYVFALHDPANDPKEAGEGGKRPHVHAHAIVTMKSEFGDRISTSPEVFKQWRETLAEKAREQGIAMEMSDRRDTATAPAYTKNQVRPVDRQARTEHVGTSQPAQRRYDAKRGGQVVHARSERSRSYTVKAKREWTQIALASGDSKVRSYAESVSMRLETRTTEAQQNDTAQVVRPDFVSKTRANMVMLQELMKEGADMADMNRQQFETYEKKMETALFNFERSVGPEQRQDFDEIATAARELVDIHREQVSLREEQQAASRVDDRGQDANAQWDAAISKHGQEMVEKGNEALVDVEFASQALDRAEAQGGDTRNAQAVYEREVSRAAELAAGGNTYVREVAERDEVLAAAVERADNEAGKPSGQGGSPNQQGTAEHGERDDADDRNKIERDERETHALHEQAQALEKQQNRVERGKTDDRTRDDVRADPAQQRIPRQEEIQRQRDDRDDHER